MKEKYKNLYKLSKDIKSFMVRLDKESTYLTIGKKIAIINSIKLNDEIIEDIIQLIQNESNLTLQDLITNVNLTIKGKRKSYKLIERKIPKEYSICVKNKKTLIKYIKKVGSNHTILTMPMDIIIDWDETKIDYHNLQKMKNNISYMLYNIIPLNYYICNKFKPCS